MKYMNDLIDNDIRVYILVMLLKHMTRYEKNESS